ncbi:DUF3099 domain-containing protein [Corynebacterium sp. NPDC060344]|uniref:DUF3099 domain-containing protein n=1 Tax=Corynebacterium sp. NPDC060344 TaxID=3347101 RepID=UPI00365A18D6
MASRRTNRRGRRGSEAVLITDARQSRIRNYNYRRHTYAALQWSRIPLLLLAAASFLWWDLTWLATILTILSVPMPWIAVVIANGVGEPADKRSPRVYKPGLVREQNRRWEEAQRERLAQLADRPAHVLGPTAAGQTDLNLPAVPDDPDTGAGHGPLGPYAGFDPSMIIDMDGIPDAPDPNSTDPTTDQSMPDTTDRPENPST